jgi:hypothetical protein
MCRMPRRRIATGFPAIVAWQGRLRNAARRTIGRPASLAG